MLIEQMSSQFEPTDEKGFNPIKSGGSLLVYEYHPENIPNSVPKDFIVAKTPGMGDQYLMGRREAVLSNAIAFNILDSLELGEMRNMSIITYPYEYESSGVEEKPEWNVFIKDLMDRFGLSSKIRWSRFDNEDIQIGVTPDVQSPLFVGYDTSKWIKSWGSEDVNLSAIFDAIIYVHEWQHICQFRDGLPVNSLWAERNAITHESELLLEILNTNKLTKRQQSIVGYYLQYTSLRIFNYRNGVGFGDHLKNSAYNSDGSPQKKHHLGDYDFKFGY